VPAWLIDRLPARFRTRKGFTLLLALVSFLGSGGYSLLIERYDPVSSLLDGCGSALFVFLFFWFVSRNMTGFAPEPNRPGN
jgi:hypothetical protein